MRARGDKTAPEGVTSSRQAAATLRNDPKHLQKMVAELNERLKKESVRFKGLGGTLRKERAERVKLRGDYANLEEDYEELKREHKRVKGNLQDIINIVVRPWAGTKKIKFSRRSLEIPYSILCQLLEDATQTTTPRDQVQVHSESTDVLHIQIQHLQEQLQAAQKQHQDLYDQNQLLRDRVQAEEVRHQTLRNQPQTEETQHRSLHNQHETVQLHLQTCLTKLRDSQGQVAALRKQVQEQRKAPTTKIGQVRFISDDHLSRDFRTLVSMVRTFSRTTTITDSVNLTGIFQPWFLLKNVSPHHCHGRAQAKLFIEAWTWSALLGMVFQNPLRVFGDHGNALDETWKDIFGEHHHQEWPIPTKLSESWRRETAERMVDLYGHNAICGGRTQGTSANEASNTSTIGPTVKSVIQTNFEQVLPEVDLQQIGQIVDKAIALAMQMSLQPFRLQVTYPEVGTRFVETEMSCLPGTEMDDNMAGVVAYIVQPGLTKWGDAYGEKYDCRLDIVTCSVQLEPDGIKREIVS